MSTKNTLNTVSSTTAAEADADGQRAQVNASGQQHHAEGEPDRGIGVLLGVRGRALGQDRTVIDAHHLQREIAERERHGDDGEERAVPARPVSRVISARYAASTAGMP